MTRYIALALIGTGLIWTGCDGAGSEADTDTDTDTDTDVDTDADTDSDTDADTYTVTLTGTGYTPHDGNSYEAVVHDAMGVVAWVGGDQAGDAISFVFNDIPDGSYDIYWYMDLVDDDTCDLASGDHVWETSVTVAGADATVDYPHDTNWTDVCADIHAPM